MNNPNEQQLKSTRGLNGFRAMILAAGLGTRLKPWTDHHPKALAVVNGKSLLQRNVQYLQGFGIIDVVVNVHHFAEQIIAAIQASKGWGSSITISNEHDEVLETGGGLLKAKQYLTGNNPFILMNADILTDLKLDMMVDYHLANAPLATIATTNRQTSRYFLFDEQDNLCGWRNVKTGEERPPCPPKGGSLRHQRAFSGIHVIDPTLFSLIRQTGKFSMVDVYLDLMQQHTIKSFDHSDSRFIDVGKPESIAAAELMFS